MRLSAAQLSSQLDAVDAAARENAQFLELEGVWRAETLDTVTRLCRIAGGSQDAAVITLCGNRQSLFAENEYAPVLLLETRAASARGRGDFESSVAAYQTAYDKLSEVQHVFTGVEDELALRRMVMLEGQAFGLYRIGGQMDEAAKRIDAALRLENRSTKAVSGFVYSTDLKIRCSRDHANVNPKAAYVDYVAILEGALRRALDDLRESNLTKVQRMNREFWQEYRENDLRYFKNDEELKMVCGLV
jgi:hypothetical protein